MQTLTIIRPDDMHLHLRDGDALKAVAPYTARQMGRAVIMPNLKPPVVSVPMPKHTKRALWPPCQKAAPSSR